MIFLSHLPNGAFFCGWHLPLHDSHSKGSGHVARRVISLMTLNLWQQSYNSKALCIFWSTLWKASAYIALGQGWNSMSMPQKYYITINDAVIVLLFVLMVVLSHNVFGVL